MGEMVKFSEVTVRYGNNVALERVSFEAEGPSLVVVVGPNGSGKTTLLKASLGLVKAEGEIKVLGMDVRENLKEIRRSVGYVPQMERIDPSFPILVKDIVMMGRTARRGAGKPFSDHDVEISKRALESVGLIDKWDEPFSHLSGGQQQRVLIARALASEPRLLLLDEPLTGVDKASQEEIIELLKNAVRSGIGVVMVTHDINPVIEITDYVLLLNRKVIAFGKPTAVIEREKLIETFGGRVEVVRMGPVCYVIGSDAHVGRSS
ncbi:metal ABC transporter ATP-binding protein [Candidatus Methanodesulfokora washburnensis]|jgi:ABC-type Mn2+/Zn2+ transport system ATPase subunit|uniref:Metal ABC transporter ATP-binding protein n=1 Tax=Candidatus Methanodesulfokora washburnensis TaxID=2478471 RepID=A0A3R9XA61_9CREN|nr:metal ABC transporter ATP-binding protein [Candidatus Methanodesulfokores washburnensis]RSN79048.1 metal ABC transporter ATP-binding protein [Candidatus Methanodesulfokores washburnensis]